MPLWNFVWRNTYHDSVTLMRLSRDLEALPGVVRAAVMMGTPPNRALLEAAGLLAPAGAQAGPADLIVAVAAADEAAAAAVEATVRTALGSAAPEVRKAASDQPPRTLRAALRRLPEATLALISVPGPYAGLEATRALRAGLHVMLFSDHVPLETEVALKHEAVERGLLLMGPDCGTAILHGIPLGFANAVGRGRVGLVAASGTGLQEVACLLARLGEGVSHAIGVGSRDLGDVVGGLMTTVALRLLAADPETAVIAVISKPPGAATARRLSELVRTLPKPCVVHLVGSSGAAVGAAPVGTLEECALTAAALARGSTGPLPPSAAFQADVQRHAARGARPLAPGQRFVRGLFAGGTLAWEARTILAGMLDHVAPGVEGEGAGHWVVDLGAERFTVGRPHPIVDGTVRREWIRREAADPSTAVLLLDVVLGYGAHPDPAGELLPALEAAQAEARREGRGLAVVASVVGTDRDPQRRADQVARLEAQGVIVMPSNAQAARLAAAIARGRP